MTERTRLPHVQGVRLNTYSREERLRTLRVRASLQSLGRENKFAAHKIDEVSIEPDN